MEVGTRRGERHDKTDKTYHQKNEIPANLKQTRSTKF